MKKPIKWIAVGICVLLVVLFTGFTMFGGAMIKGAVNGFGPTVMGVPVTLEKASFRPLSGSIKLTNLHVGNPKGFNTPALFDLGEVDVSNDVKTLFSDTIIIRKINVVSPRITYERALTDSNFGALTRQLQGEKPQPAAAGTSGTSAASKEARKVIIDELIVSDPSLNVSITAAGGRYIPVKLGNVELKNIGREGGGVTFADAFVIIFSVITSNIENAVKGAGDLLGTGAKAVTDGVKETGGKVLDGATSIIKGVGGLFDGNKNTASDPAK